MDVLNTTKTFSGVDLTGAYSMGDPPGGVVLSWTNSTGRAVRIGVALYVGSAAGSTLASGAAVITAYIGTTPEVDGVKYYHTGFSQSKVDDALGRITIYIPDVYVLAGESLEIQVHSTNSSDTAVSGEVFLFDINAGIDMRAVNGSAPMDTADILAGLINDGGSGTTKLTVDGNGRIDLSKINGVAQSSDLDTIVADTNELQTDLADGGRLDLLIDAIKAVTDGIDATRLEKATKTMVNKSTYNKSTGVMTVYDDDGTTPILTLTMSDADSTETRTPS